MEVEKNVEQTVNRKRKVPKGKRFIFISQIYDIRVFYTA